MEKERKMKIGRKKILKETENEKAQYGVGVGGVYDFRPDPFSLTLSHPLVSIPPPGARSGRRRRRRRRICR
jgi:hypothetical protein